MSDAWSLSPGPLLVTEQQAAPVFLLTPLSPTIPSGVPLTGGLFLFGDIHSSGEYRRLEGRCFPSY
jgi:hypothetical protein